MKKFEEDESFLARWAANELTPEELKEFESEEEFALFHKINQEVSQFRVAKADVEGDYQKVQQKLTGKGKVVRLNRLFYVAASIALLFGLFWFVNSSKTISAEFGEKFVAELPDGSKVHLNAGSEIQYKRFFWNDNREIQLEGEAYFEVVKAASKFNVFSESGRVEVLGTKFNIYDRDESYEVVCFSGKVAVNKSGENEPVFLEKGDKVLYKDGQTETAVHQETAPNWKNGITSFSEAQLSVVLASLERQYNVKIETNKVDTSALFTGSFVHNDLSLALKTTLPVLGVSYELSSDKKVIRLKENP